MPVTVAIVLNEREPEKLLAAGRIESFLLTKDCTVTRIPCSPSLGEIIKESAPQVLILDYLLGDYGTGLDIFISLQELPETKRPRVFFFTDEPSVGTAVDAMKLGAEDYIISSAQEAEQRLCSEVRDIISKLKLSKQPEKTRDLRITDLPSEAEASRELIRTLTASAAGKIAIFLGASGSGKATVARALFQEHCRLTNTPPPPSRSRSAPGSLPILPSSCSFV